MSRVIQDSDDEGDLDSLSSPESNAAQSPGRDAGNASVLVPSGGRSAPGTSSTELVQRNIENAHQQLVEQASLSNGNRTHAPDNLDVTQRSSSSPKRRRVMTSSEANMPPAKLIERRKTAQTYGSSKAPKLGRVQDTTSAFDAMKELDFTEHSENMDSYLGAEGKTSQNEGDVQGHGTSPQKNSAPSLPSSMRHDFAQHEPFVMFPEEGSTIPNATMTQKMMLEAAQSGVDPMQLVGGPLMDTAGETKSSIPWSAYIESPKTTAGSVANSPVRSEPKAEETEPSFSSSRRTKSTQILPVDKNGCPGSSSSRIRRTKTMSAARLSQESQDELADESFSMTARQPKKKSSEPASTSSRRTPSTAVPGSNSRQHDQDKPAQDNLNPKPETDNHGNGEQTPQRGETHAENPNDSIQDSIRAVRLAKNSERKQNISSEPLNSDDIAVGLPKERYQPRPSRSRSTRTLEEPIDYSVAPEKAVKQRAKRRKTTDIAAFGRLKLSLAEKIESLEKDGFSQTQARQALKVNDNDLDSALKWLATHAAASISEQATNNPSPEAKGVAAKTNGSTEFDDEAVRDGIALSGEVTKIPTSMEARVEIPAPRTNISSDSPKLTKRKRGRSSKASAASASEGTVAQPAATLADIVDGLEYGDDPAEASRISAERLETEKQNTAEERGPSSETRPTAPAMDPDHQSTEHAVAPDGPLETVEPQPPKKRARGRPKKSETASLHTAPIQPQEPAAPANAPEPLATAPPTNAENECITSPQQPNSNLATANNHDAPAQSARPQTPQRQSSDLKSDGTGTQSPGGSKGRPTYRVGLSKRARIKPLLRSVKKG